MTKTKHIEIETSSYARAHGKQPKGFGVWAFQFHQNNQSFPQAAVEFTPGPMLFTDAKRWAKERGRELNAYAAVVMS